MRSLRTIPMIVGLATLTTTVVGQATDTTQYKAMDIYGFTMMDMGYNAGAIHPDWFDVMRPTKLPSRMNSAVRATCTSACARRAWG